MEGRESPILSVPRGRASPRGVRSCLARSASLTSPLPSNASRPRATAGPSGSSTSSWSTSSGGAIPSPRSRAATRTSRANMSPPCPRRCGRPATRATRCRTSYDPLEGPRSRRRLRPHPQPPRVVEPAACARVSPVPVVSTFHGRLNLPWAEEMFETPDPRARGHQQEPGLDPPGRALGRVVHNGLTLMDAPFERRRSEDLCFVGRVAPKKGIVEAIEIALGSRAAAPDRGQGRAVGPEREYYDAVFQPALKAAGARRRVPRRVDRARSRPAVCRQLRLADARIVARAIRPRGDRVARVRHAGRRAPDRRPARDHPRRRRRVLRRRRDRRWHTRSTGSRTSIERPSATPSSSASRPRG